MKNQKKESCDTQKVNSFTQIDQIPKERIKSFFARDEVRHAEPMIDIIFPSVAFPSNKIFKTIGESRIREMVWYHHELLLKTKVGKLFPANKEAFKMTVDATADFFIEALGGENIFTSVHGEPKLRVRHFKIPIDENDREIWLSMYKKTLKEIDFPKEHLEEFWNWIEPLSIRMINRRTNMQNIKRHYWHEVKSTF